MSRNIASLDFRYPSGIVSVNSEIIDSDNMGFVIVRYISHSIAKLIQITDTHKLIGEVEGDGIRNSEYNRYICSQQEMKRKVCIITGTRAEWGLLSGVARELASRPDVELQIVATNMHLDPAYGMTVNEITGAGFSVDARVPLPATDGTPASTVKAMAACMAGMADALQGLSPDIAVILGDRTEMLAVASACAVSGVSIVHLHGGEVTEGAIDDSIRHAITKLSALHLTATEDYRRRVIQLGEDPARVINTGALGVHNALNVAPMDAEELCSSIGFQLDRDTVLVTFHPATLDPADPADRFAQLLEALDSLPAIRALFTYPNNDSRGQKLIAMIEDYVASHPDTTAAIPSLGMRRYLSALRLVGAVVGNSSSGIIEVPSMGIPTVDIGMRQRGRTAAESVIHCGDSATEIASAIQLALSPAMQEKAKHVSNPYYRPDTLRLVTEAIALTPLENLRTKKFHDISF